MRPTYNGGDSFVKFHHLRKFDSILHLIARCMTNHLCCSWTHRKSNFSSSVGA